MLSRRTGALVPVVVAAFSAVPAVRAQEPAAGARGDTIRGVQLDPIVVSASKRPEKALNAPARVEVVGERTIDERPAITPVEHLRSVPGIDIATTGVQSANVVARGFNNIFSGALHFLTDYRIAGVPSLRVNFLHFVPSNNEDLERMEVVLGPGAALYGPNTANGILHIITKSPLTEQGTTVTVAGGEQEVLHGTFRTAQLIGENFGVKLSGQYLRAEEWRYTDPAEVAEQQKYAANLALQRQFLMQATGISQAEADARIARIGRRDNQVERWGGEVRADWRVNPDATAVFSAGLNNQASGVELTGLGAGQAIDWKSIYYQTRFSWNRFFAQAYLNQSDAGETYLLRNGAPISDESRLWVGQVQHGFSLGERQTFTYGADYIFTDPRTQGTINGIYEDDDQTRELGAYLQSETSLHPKLDLVLAGRVDDHSALPELVFSPRAALVFTPAENQAFRISYNRAFSTPSSLNQFLDLGSPLSGNSPQVQALSSLGYSLRIQGTGDRGFRFRQQDGSYLMRSPFTPASLGGPAQALPANTATGYALAVGVVAAGAARAGTPLPAQLVAFLNQQAPGVAAAAGLNYLSVLGGGGALSSLNLSDIAPIRESTSNDFEVGYKGIVGGRLLLAADAWYSRKENLVTPLTVQTPLLFLNPQATGAYLIPRVTQFFMAAGVPQAQAQVQATALVTQIASVPVGVVASPDAVTTGGQLLVTYQNVDEDIETHGVDLSATALLSDVWSLGVTGSWVNKDVFETSSGQLVTLNAPKRKGSVTLNYRNDDSGLDSHLRVRYNDSFPVNSGVYVGTACLPNQTGALVEPCVDSYTLLDAGVGYRIPGTEGLSVQLNVLNLLDEKYRSFPGAPFIRRMALLRLRYEF
ncbi:MAG TPA: TonB-dependent receptor [Longimicrobiaceae bacterium]|nr:TonB-dependent receptor [Longimicrobiaceae bacterium]